MFESDLIQGKWYNIEMNNAKAAWKGMAKFIGRVGVGIYRSDNVFKFACDDGLQGIFALDEIISPTNAPEWDIDNRDKFIEWVKKHIAEAEKREDKRILVVLPLEEIKDKLNELRL